MTKNYQTKLEGPLTPAHEDYLKAIYVLEMNGEKVNNSALANHMGFAPASATNMVKKLAQLNLVEYEPYQGVRLTRLGRQVALEVLRHHRLLELFLHETLAMSWDKVHEEAEKLEHVMSEALEDAIATVLGHPTVDPHGDPIPSKDGQVARQPGVPLSAVGIHQDYILVRVLHQDQERLHYLGSLGLYPGTRISVLERTPFHGPLLVEIEGEKHALAFDMAETLLVTLIDTS
ncbi:MAG: metal-dependent transcriptional regulator [Caldilineaceae bacterium]|nr:metal-dependent transcriptional regulator [Caldilineaceae bacterium]